MKQVQPILISISEQEMEQRNRKFKNWGIYKPIDFKKSNPLLTFTISKYLLLYLLINLVLLSRLMMSQINRLMTIFIVLVFVLIHSLFLKLQRNPGVSSSSFPIVNLAYLPSNIGCCSQCNVIQNESTEHCKQCGVCIEGKIFHSWFLNRCITTAESYFVTFVLTLILVVVWQVFSIYLLYNNRGQINSGEQ